MLTLDEALEDFVPPVLWLLEALPDGSRVRLALEPRRSAGSARSRRSGGCCCARAGCSRCCVVFEDLHWVDGETQAFLDSLVESLPTARHPARRQLPARVPARLGAARRTTASSGSIRCRPRAPTSCSRRLARRRRERRRRCERLLIERTEGNPLFLEESVRALVETRALVGERGDVPAREGAGDDPGPGDGAGDPRRAHRPPARRAEAAAPGGRGRRQGRAVRPAAWRSPTSTRTRCTRGLAQLQAGGVPLRDVAVPRPRVHVQARAHARGRVLEPARRAPAAAPRRHRGGDRAPARRPPRRAGRAARPPRACAASCGTRRCATCARRGRRRWPGPPIARRSVSSSRRSTLLGELPETPETLSEALDTRIALGPGPRRAEGRGRLGGGDLVRLRAQELVDRLGDTSPPLSRAVGPLVRRLHAAASTRRRGTSGSGCSRPPGAVSDSRTARWKRTTRSGRRSRRWASRRRRSSTRERGIALYDARAARPAGVHVRRSRRRRVLPVPAGGSTAGCSASRIGPSPRSDDALRLADRAAASVDRRRSPCGSRRWVHYQRGDRDATVEASERLLVPGARARVHRRGATPPSSCCRRGPRGGAPRSPTRSPTCTSGLVAGAGPAWRHMLCLCVLAELYAGSGAAPTRDCRVLASIAEAERSTVSARRRCIGSRASCSSQRSAPDADAAERCFRRAIGRLASASEKSLELRAAMSLARLLRGRGAPRGARRALAPGSTGGSPKASTRPTFGREGAPGRARLTRYPLETPPRRRTIDHHQSDRRRLDRPSSGQGAQPVLVAQAPRRFHSPRFPQPARLSRVAGRPVPRPAQDAGATGASRAGAATRGGRNVVAMATAPSPIVAEPMNIHA